jgi:hypothetical protein
MNVYKVSYRWEDPKCQCELCASSGMPHENHSVRFVTAETIQAALTDATTLIMAESPANSHPEIFAIEFHCAGEVAPEELSLQAEAEVYESPLLDEEPEDWRKRFEDAGVTGEAERLAREFLPEDQQAAFVQSIYRHGPWGHHMLELSGYLKLTGQLKPGLFHGLKKLFAKVQ